MSELTPCKLGRVEQDGAQYCHEHHAFRECWVETSFCSAVETELAARRVRKAAGQ